MLYATGTLIASARSGRAGVPRQPICLTQSSMTPLHGGGIGMPWLWCSIAMRGHSGSAFALPSAVLRPSAAAGGIAWIDIPLTKARTDSTTINRRKRTGIISHHVCGRRYELKSLRATDAAAERMRTILISSGLSMLRERFLEAESRHFPADREMPTGQSRRRPAACSRSASCSETPARGPQGSAGSTRYQILDQCRGRQDQDDDDEHPNQGHAPHHHSAHLIHHHQRLSFAPRGSVPAACLCLWCAPQRLCDAAAIP